jgi:CubicO group peptidase (beta-lactamase class C family)
VSSGHCDARFAAVRDAFESSFAAGFEVGAACAVVLDGVLVVDLWGGHTYEGGPEWRQDTLVETRSATKGVTAIALHLLIDRGLVDLDAPVRRWWPELRADPLVRHVLTHTAGIPIIDAPLADNAILDWDAIADAVAVQEPMWEPGAQQGYHGVTFGWLVGQVVRAVTGQLVGGLVRDEIAGPLDVDYSISTPASEHHRIAPLVLPPAASRPDGSLGFTSPEPGSVMARMFAPMFPPICPSWSSPEFRMADIPVTNGICTARALATIYGELGRGGGRLVSADTVAQMGALQTDGEDVIFGVPIRRSLGFELRADWQTDARPDTAFGHPGASGFLGFADPAAGVGFAYVKNAGWGGAPGTDPRAGVLIDALYDSLRG